VVAPLAYEVIADCISDDGAYLCPIHTADATQLIRRVESHPWCVYGIRNQLVTVSSLNKLGDSKVELRRVGSVNAPVGSRHKLVANLVHVADTTQLDS